MADLAYWRCDACGATFHGLAVVDPGFAPATAAHVFRHRAEHHRRVAERHDDTARMFEAEASALRVAAGLVEEVSNG